LLTADLTTPVCVFVAETLTPGIKAPDASETVPLNVEFDWAKTREWGRRNTPTLRRPK